MTNTPNSDARTGAAGLPPRQGGKPGCKCGPGCQCGQAPHDCGPACPCADVCICTPAANCAD